MNRSQRRLSNKSNPKYTTSKSEIQSLARKALQADIDRLKKEVYDEARIDFMVGALALPMMVLMDHFWQKSYARKIPKFTELLLEYFSDWENGIITDEQMVEDLWNYGGVRLQRCSEKD
jgi:hypothetical protein